MVTIPLPPSRHLSATKEQEEKIPKIPRIELRGGSVFFEGLNDCKRLNLQIGRCEVCVCVCVLFF